MCLWLWSWSTTNHNHSSDQFACTKEKVHQYPLVTLQNGMAKIRYVPGGPTAIWYCDDWMEWGRREGRLVRCKWEDSMTARFEFHICCHTSNTQKKAFSHVNTLSLTYDKALFDVTPCGQPQRITEAQINTNKDRQVETLRAAIHTRKHLELSNPLTTQNWRRHRTKTRRDFPATTAAHMQSSCISTAWGGWRSVRQSTLAQAIYSITGIHMHGFDTLLSSDLCACIIWPSLTFNCTSTKTFIQSTTKPPLSIIVCTLRQLNLDA
jgi:hypothetical protein